VTRSCSLSHIPPPQIVRLDSCTFHGPFIIHCLQLLNIHLRIELPGRSTILKLMFVHIGSEPQAAWLNPSLQVVAEVNYRSNLCDPLNG
jgi:hypothetical protein